MRTVKTLIRLGGCPGWSESSLGALASFSVFLWGGSYVLKVWWDALCTEGGEEQPSPIKLGVPRQDQIVQSARWFALGLATYRCHAGLSCTTDEYPPVCINWWQSRFHADRTTVCFYTDRSKAVLLLWFLTVTCSCCPYLYFGLAIIVVTYFVNFR